MSTPYQRIEGHEQVLRAFGYWPDFHDAEVRSLLMDRNTRLFDDVVANARIEVCLHAFEWTRDAQPCFNHHLVQLRFHYACDLALKGFNHQNAILEFKVEDYAFPPDAPVGFRITFVPAHGLSGSFSAAGAEVLSVLPCDEQGEPRQRVEPAAAPNGGPATPLGKSSVTEGPPSVS